MPSAAAASTASSMRTMPSTIEYSLWSRRWMNDGAGIDLFYALPVLFLIGFHAINARNCTPAPSMARVSPTVTKTRSTNVLLRRGYLHGLKCPSLRAYRTHHRARLERNVDPLKYLFF